METKGRCLLFLMAVLLTVVDPLKAHLYQGDRQALKDVKSSLRDVPGSFFFDSWDFKNDPCSSFTGVVCANVDGVMRVRELNLGTGLADSPGLRGELNHSLGSLSRLTQLTVVPGEVSGYIPESLGDLLQLEFLGISKNWLFGAIPESLAALESLQTLDLSYNQLTGSIPSGLGELPSLKALILGHNNLVGTIPTISSPLLHLDLRENMLSGNLPVLPPSLRYLCVSRNELSGKLDSLVSLANAAHLDLSFNQFIGTLPAAILAMKLSFLLVQRNLLSGTITPPRFVTIGSLDLSYNGFSGRLSPLLASAGSLYLNNNDFSGEVPKEFVDQLVSGNLQNLYLQHNFLTDIKLEPDVPLPTTSSLCVQFNCLNPPSQSNCPISVGTERSRPIYECH